MPTGHTRGHIAFWEENAAVLFSGDTLFGTSHRLSACLTCCSGAFHVYPSVHVACESNHEHVSSWHSFEHALDMCKVYTTEIHASFGCCLQQWVVADCLRVRRSRCGIH